MYGLLLWTVLSGKEQLSKVLLPMRCLLTLDASQVGKEVENQVVGLCFDQVQLTEQLLWMCDSVCGSKN